MAIIVPNIGPSNVSLSSSLITPGFPLVVVPSSSPVAELIVKDPPTVAKDLVAAAPTVQKLLHSSGHDADRSL
jgi:hypothetical protein